MNYSFIFLALFLFPVMPVAHAQGLTDSINNAVENNIENTFDSINQAFNIAVILPLELKMAHSLLLPPPPPLQADLAIQIPLLQQ